MSSEYQFFATLQTVVTNIYLFGGPIMIGLGTISCILSLLVFTKKTLRKNPCTMYLIAFNVNNIILIYTVMLQSILITGYSINFPVRNLIFCRFYLYATFVTDSLSSSFLMLASIDRVLVTSPNALTRRA